jgi:hypothetical protein
LTARRIGEGNFCPLPDCHCERSEAIQNIRLARLDCFVALLLAMTRAKMRQTVSERRHCERSEAIQDISRVHLDCFVAMLLAMTRVKCGNRQTFLAVFNS